MQNPDEPIAELAQGGEMTDSTTAQLVVVPPRTRRDNQRALRLARENVDEPVVVHEPSGHGLLLARLTGDRTGRRVVLSRSGVCVALGVVAELRKRPHRQHRPQPGLTAVDLRLGMGIEGLTQAALQRRDLGVHRSDDRDQRASDRSDAAATAAGWVRPGALNCACRATALSLTP